VSVEPVTATLPVVPLTVQSGVPPFCGAAVGHEPAAVAGPAPSVIAVAATEAASATEEYIREDFTADTLQPHPVSIVAGHHKSVRRSSTRLARRELLKNAQQRLAVRRSQ